MTVVTSTIWQLVCPVTEANGSIATTTRPLPATFTAPTGTRAANVLPSVAMPAVDPSELTRATGTILPPDTLIPDDGVRRLTVHIPIHTTIVVDIFPNPVPSPVETYRPVWDVTRDGSLVTPIYHKTASQQHSLMIVSGFLLCVFIRNVVVSIGYLRRGRAKDKTLFYLLLASQLWGPVAFISVITGTLDEYARCDIINAIVSISAQVSMSLLITGILGLKAYRCLNRSKLVLAGVAAFQIASAVVFVMEMLKVTSTRALNGMCFAVVPQGGIMIPTSMTVTFLETAFLTLCFLFAVWRSLRTAQGRLSIALSVDGGSTRDSIAPSSRGDVAAATTQSRGWWDYVPETESHDPARSNGDVGGQENRAGTPDSRQVLLTGEKGSIWTRVFGPVLLLMGRIPLIRSSNARVPPRKPSVHSSEPIPQPGRQASVPNDQQTMGTARPRRLRIPGPDASSSVGRWRIPNLVRGVVRGELFYTAAITSCCLISSVISTGAASREAIFSVQLWIQINWAITSLMVMRSYAQVVRRHEREQILQQPLSWHATTDQQGNTSMYRREPSRFSLTSALSPRNGHSSQIYGGAESSRHSALTHQHNPGEFNEKVNVTPPTRRKSSTSTSPSILIAREYANPFSDNRRSNGQSSLSHDHGAAARPDSSMLPSRTVTPHSMDGRASPTELEREYERVMQGLGGVALPAVRFSGDSWHTFPDVPGERRSARRSVRLPPLGANGTGSSRAAQGASSALNSPVMATWNEASITRRQKSQG